MSGKGLILSDQMIKQLTEWFGPNKEDWSKQEIVVYAKNVRDSSGKVVGQTLSIARPGDELIDKYQHE